SQSGGLVGENRGEIFNSFSTAQVTGINMVGGLAGANYGGKDSGIRNSHATGNVSGDVGVGGLAGWSYGVMMNNYATGHVSGEERSGGLVGESYADTYNSYATGNVSAPGIKVGALVGENYGEILNTYAHGNVLGGSEVGGLVGCNYGIVRESFSTGNVNGSERIGGLAGESYGEVSNSYARGRVNGSSMVGGLVGNNSKFGITDGGDIFNTYAAGRVAGNNSVGGLIGNNIASIRSSYWDLESTEQFHGIGTSESGSFDEIEGLNTSEMTGTAAEEHMPSFPFYEKWITETDDYPRLLWELPYFMIRITEADNPVYRGNSNVITAMVTNIGGVEDRQTIELINDAGQILDIHEDLTLAGGDSLEIVLSWTPGEDDPLREYELIVRTLNRSETVNTRLEEHPDNIPSALTLSQNFPNPFNSSTVISYGLPETSHVRLEVFDLLGRRVRLLLNDEISAGRHRVLFDAGGLPSGMYLYRLSAGNTLQSRTLHYIK
ncbi:MAG: GLUG motif-containing protein, partial [Balneolales bacterium]